jgi:hypothetical protein
MTPADQGTSKNSVEKDATAQAEGDSAGPRAGVVVALCAGHRCAALTKTCRDDLAGAIARSRGGILISSPCLQQCAQGAVGAIAIRTSSEDTTGPSIWLGGLNQDGHLQSLAHWVEHWQPVPGQASMLPDDLGQAVIGSGLPIRLTSSTPAAH